MNSRFLQQVLLLAGPGQDPAPADVLLEQGSIAAIGSEAAAIAARRGLEPLPAEAWLLAPALVDPHSLLEDPCNGVAETQASLERSAVAAGYGTVALLPQARRWRDSPEALQQQQRSSGLQFLLWEASVAAARGRSWLPMRISWRPGRSVWLRGHPRRRCRCWSGPSPWARWLMHPCCWRPAIRR